MNAFPHNLVVVEAVEAVEAVGAVVEAVVAAVVAVVVGEELKILWKNSDEKWVRTV